jgi:hypothetical protein
MRLVPVVAAARRRLRARLTALAVLSPLALGAALMWSAPGALADASPSPGPVTAEDGTGSLVYVAVAVAVLVGAIVVVLLVRRGRGRALEE